MEQGCFLQLILVLKAFFYNKLFLNSFEAIEQEV